MLGFVVVDRWVRMWVTGLLAVGAARYIFLVHCYHALEVLPPLMLSCTTVMLS